MRKRHLYIVAVLSIVTAAALWGMQGIVLLPSLNNLPVDFVVFFSYALPFIIMNFIFFKEYKNFRYFCLKDILALSLIGLLGGIIGTMAIVKALFLVNFNNLSVVVLIQKTQPIFAVIMARILLKEKVGKIFYVWAIIVMVGVYFMTFGFYLPEISLNDNMLMAGLLAIVSAACFASNTVFGRYLSKNLSYITITFYRYGFTTIFGLFFMYFLSGFTGFEKLTSFNWLIFFIIVLTSGPISMFIYYFGLKYVKASTSSICELSLPITAVILEYIIYGGILGPVQWCGAAVMIYGIYKITQNQVMESDRSGKQFKKT